MLQRVHFFFIQFLLSGFHGIPHDDSGKQTAYKIGHFHIRNLFQQGMDQNPQATGEQKDEEGIHHPLHGKRQYFLFSFLNGRRSIFRQGLQMITVDQVPGSRSSEQRRHHHAKGAGCHSNDRGSIAAQFFKNGTEGTGCPYAAVHGG